MIEQRYEFPKNLNLPIVILSFFCLIFDTHRNNSKSRKGYDSVNFSHFNKPARQFKLFVFDMDSTLIDAEVIDTLAKAADVEERVSKATEAAMSGKMDYTESFQMRVACLKGLPIEKARIELEKIELMPGAVELMKYIHDIGGKTAMITCGFSLVADDIKKRLNLDYVYSNDLIIEKECLTGDAVGPLMITDAKAKVLDDLIQKTGVPYEECMVVGDGANDICMFKKAGYSIAFNAKPIVQEHAHAIVSEKDLRNIIPIIKSMTDTSAAT
jgi:phosphoserine phosphatase SerB